MFKIKKLENKIFDLNLAAMMAESNSINYYNIVKKIIKFRLLKDRLEKINKIKQII